MPWSAITDVDLAPRCLIRGVIVMNPRLWSISGPTPIELPVAGVHCPRSAKVWNEISGRLSRVSHVQSDLALVERRVGRFRRDDLTKDKLQVQE